MRVSVYDSPKYALVRSYGHFGSVGPLFVDSFCKFIVIRVVKFLIKLFRNDFARWKRGTVTVERAKL